MVVRLIDPAIGKLKETEIKKEKEKRKVAPCNCQNRNMVNFIIISTNVAKIIKRPSYFDQLDKFLLLLGTMQDRQVKILARPNFNPNCMWVAQSQLIF